MSFIKIKDDFLILKLEKVLNKKSWGILESHSARVMWVAVSAMLLRRELIESLSLRSSLALCMSLRSASSV